MEAAGVSVTVDISQLAITVNGMGHISTPLIWER